MASVPMNQICPELPEDVWETILGLVSSKKLARNCMLVCRMFRDCGRRILNKSLCLAFHLDVLGASFRNNHEGNCYLHNEVNCHFEDHIDSLIRWALLRRQASMKVFLLELSDEKENGVFHPPKKYLRSLFTLGRCSQLLVLDMDFRADALPNAWSLHFDNCLPSSLQILYLPENIDLRQPECTKLKLLDFSVTVSRMTMAAKSGSDYLTEQLSGLTSLQALRIRTVPLILFWTASLPSLPDLRCLELCFQDSPFSYAKPTPSVRSPLQSLFLDKIVRLEFLSISCLRSLDMLDLDQLRVHPTLREVHIACRHASATKLFKAMKSPQLIALTIERLHIDDPYSFGINDEIRVRLSTTVSALRSLTINDVCHMDIPVRELLQIPDLQHLAIKSSSGAQISLPKGASAQERLNSTCISTITFSHGFSVQDQAILRTLGFKLYSGLCSENRQGIVRAELGASELSKSKIQGRAQTILRTPLYTAFESMGADLDAEGRHLCYLRYLAEIAKT